MKLIVERQADRTSGTLPPGAITDPGPGTQPTGSSLIFATPTTPSSSKITSTSSPSIQSSPTASSSSTSSPGLPLGTLIPAIVVPIAVVAIIAPVALYFFLTRHDRRSKSALSSRVSSRAFQDHIPPEPRVETKSPAEYSSETNNSKASDVMNFNLGPGVEKPLPPTQARKSPENMYDRNVHHPEWPGRPPTAERQMQMRPSTADRPLRPVRHERGAGSYERPERPNRANDTFAYEVKRSAQTSPVTGPVLAPVLSPSADPATSPTTSPTGGGPGIGQAISRYSGLTYDNPPRETLLPPNPHPPPMPGRPTYVNRTSIQDLTEENLRIGRLATDSRASFGLRGRDIDEVSEVSASGRLTGKDGKKGVDELSDVSSVYDDESRSKTDPGGSLLGNQGARRSGPLR